MFYILSSTFITNIRKRKNFIIYSKFQMIELRQNNKFDISNRYFSQTHKRNINQFVQIRSFYHRFHLVNFIAKLDTSNRIFSQHTQYYAITNMNLNNYLEFDMTS